MAYCEDYIDLISASLDGALSPAQQEKLEGHLAACPACKALYDDLAALHAGLAALPSPEPPADLTERIMAAVEAEKRIPFPVKRSFQWKKWMASAAVLAIIIAGAWSWNRSSVGSSGSLMPVSALADASMNSATEAAPREEPKAPEVPSPNFQAPSSKQAVTGSSTPEPAAVQSYGAFQAVTPSPDAAEGISPQSAEFTGPLVRSAQAPVPTAAETITEETGPMVAETVPAEDAPMAPRLFSAPLPVAAGGDGEVSEETLYDQTGESLPAGTEAPDFIVPPTDAGEPVPNSFALTSQSIESEEPSQTITAQQAAQALADYIYEFVEQVEPMALEESERPAWRLSSPTGVSGTAVLEGETEQVFRFLYQDEEGGEPLSYTVDKMDGNVLFSSENSSN